MVDTQKALDDLNKAEGWIDKHPRFAAIVSLLVGVVVGAMATCVHLHR